MLGSPPPSVHPFSIHSAPPRHTPQASTTVNSLPWANMRDALPLTPCVCALWLSSLEFSPEADLAPHKYPLALQDSAQVFPTASTAMAPQTPGPQPGLATSSSRRGHAPFHLWAAAQVAVPPGKPLLQMLLCLPHLLDLHPASLSPTNNSSPRVCVPPSDTACKHLLGANPRPHILPLPYVHVLHVCLTLSKGMSEPPGPSLEEFLFWNVKWQTQMSTGSREAL